MSDGKYESKHVFSSSDYITLFQLFNVHKIFDKHFCRLIRAIIKTANLWVVKSCSQINAATLQLSCKYPLKWGFQTDRRAAINKVTY